MIEARHLKKTYRTGGIEQKALDDISLTFRDNEFAAILGPSGSGKTTLLNVLGGLDHADSGELVINGISTEKYKSRDWETYRNHRIGFIFQSYNLIPHQNILSNVELALTIAGISGEERKTRSIKALEKVGLGDQIHKHPSQLSGGQMQRVAIARALVNDPDIVLADEPTGALDTETGLQVMNLLKEVAMDRLVIMVTHNPELADSYATRIIRLRDGKIEDDNMPVTQEERMAQEAAPVPVPGSGQKAGGKGRFGRGGTAGRKKRASMSFLTALSLSFSNLMSKKGRTFLTAFAGSIGITGIAAIMAVSNGVNDYIDQVEADTLSAYPVSLTKNSADLQALFDEGQEDMQQEQAAAPAVTGTKKADDDTEAETTVNPSDIIPERKMLSSMLDTIHQNDLGAFKKYLEKNIDRLDGKTNGIDYDYGITPIIYTENVPDVISPDSETAKKRKKHMLLNGSVSSQEMDTMSTMGSAMGFMTGSGTVFQEMLDNQELLKEQYEICAGRWPEKMDEAVLILSSSGSLSDYTLYHIGVLNKDEYESGYKALGESKEIKLEDPDVTMSYKQAMQLTYDVVPASFLYSYNESTKTWNDRSADTDFLDQQLQKGIRLKITGIIKPNGRSRSTALSEGIGYTQALSEELIRLAEDSQIVAQQLKNPKVDVFTGKTFDELQKESGQEFDLSKIFSVDEDAIKEAFSMDTDSLENLGSGFDTSGLDMGDPDALSSALSSIDTDTILSLMTDGLADELAGLPEYLQQSGIHISEDERNMITGTTQDLMTRLLAGFSEYANQQIRQAIGQNQPDTQAISQKLQELITQTAADLAAGKEIDQQALQEAVGQIISEALPGQTADIDLGQLAQDYLNQDSTQKLINESVADLAKQINDSKIQEKLTSAIGNYISSILARRMSSAMSQLMQTMGSVISQQITNMITANISGISQQLQSAMAGAFQFDPQSLAGAFQLNMTADELTSLLTDYMNASQLTYDNNLTKLGWAQVDDPSSINIYPIDLDAKTDVMNFIADYNKKVEKEGKDNLHISYSDVMGAVLGNVTDIINMVSFVLIAFVSVSLVVSSIMIGIITYISVLERRKEIGILRAMGASKGNVANIFNAETFIEGLISGLIAIAIVYAVTPFANRAILTRTNVANIMQLHPQNALMLVGVSVLLTLIAGLIPSSAASRRDPVEALRSE